MPMGMPMTRESSKEEISSVMEVTNVPEEKARSLLRQTGNNVQAAINLFFRG